MHFEQTTQKVDFNQMLFDRQARQIPIDYDKGFLVRNDNGNLKGEKRNYKNYFDMPKSTKSKMKNEKMVYNDLKKDIMNNSQYKYDDKSNSKLPKIYDK